MTNEELDEVVSIATEQKAAKAEVLRLEKALRAACASKVDPQNLPRAKCPPIEGGPRAPGSIRR